MQKTLLYFLLFYFTSNCFYAQKKSTVLYGKILSNNKAVYNVNVYNLSTKRGTFTDKKGAFRIFAKENDSIQISSVGFVTKIFIPKPFNFGMDKNHINIEKTNYVLEEVLLKKHNLSGNLISDTKRTPKDSIGNLVKKMVLGIKKLDYDAIATMDIGFDELHLVKPKKVVTIPNYYQGVGTSFGIGGNSDKKENLFIKKVKEKNLLPDLLLDEFGEHFFFKDLKIPKENYYHFIDFCSYKNISKLHQNKELLKLIRILQEESIIYLKTIRREK